MGTNSGTLQVLANQLGLALGLLEDELADAGLTDLLAKLGVRLPPELAAVSTLAAAAETAATDAAGLAPLVQALLTAVEADDPTTVLTATEKLIAQIAATIGAVEQVETELTAVVASSALTAAQQAQLAAFAETVAERVLDYVVVRRLAESAPLLLATLDVAGLLDHEPVDVATDDPLAVGHTRTELHLDRLGTMVSTPADHLKTVYGWGGPSFDALELFSRLQRVLDATGQVQTHLLTPTGQSPLLEAYLLGFTVDDTVTPTGLVVSVRFPGSESFTRSYPLSDPWTIEVDATASFAEDLSAAIAPPFAATLKPPSGTVDATVTAGLHATPPAGTPVVLIGDPGGTRLQADKAAFDVGFSVTWDPADNQATGEPTLSLTLTNGHLIVSLGGADGFLASVLPQTLDVTAAVDAEWRPSTGLVFKGGAALVVTIPVNARIGPAHIAVLDVGLGIDPSALTLALRVSGDIALGPFAASVKDVGAAVALGFQRGNLGPVDLSFHFLPPTGLGLSVGSGPISGGGFIGYDPATGQYSGSFQLTAGSVGISATGLLDTRLPTGPGYALLILLRATFPAIEIGFGFALTSVGGLLALNRSVDVDTLRARLAAGTAGRILAPEDPVRNAPMLLADLQTAFPVTPGITVIGPTLELTWADLVTFDVGVFLEFPGPRRVVLLGSARATIDDPSGGGPYLQIRVDILGEIDVQKKTVSFDAVLVDSTLMQILALTGGAAFRLSYGAEPYVVLTIGGFYPGFSPSPLVFPSSLTRIAMTRGTPSDTLYMRFEGYFALTTNTLQFGASIEVVINLDPFNIQGLLSFDTLIQREPFHFTFDIHASVNVRYKSHNLGGLDLKGQLSGPGPVIFHGSVSIEILFFSISFDETFTLGSSSPPPVTTVASALAELAGELSNPANLRASATTDPWVALAPPPASGPPVVSPLGQLVWTQQRAPLELLLQKFGDAPLASPQTVHVTGPDVAGPDQDWFAPGQFTTLSDADALSAPSFERLQGGVRLGPTGADDGPAATITVTVKQIRIPAPPVLTGTFTLPAWLVLGGLVRTGGVVASVAAPALAVNATTWQVHAESGALLASGLTQSQAHQMSRQAAAAAVPTDDVLAAFAF
jgi:hypothetical protein